MRFFILIISLLFTYSLSNAQKLNHQGKKMVCSVTSFKPDKKWTTKYIFSYDNDNRLIKVDHLCKGITFFTNIGWVKDKGFKLYERLEYKDGKLQRTDYDEYGHKKTKFIYSYVLDSDRYVVERTFKDVSGTDKWYLKEVTRFTYGYPYKDDIRQIVKEAHYSYIGELIKDKRVEKEVVGDRFTTWYDIIGGNTYYRGRNDKYACEYNDLNINVSDMLQGDIERLTEWYNFYSRCLPLKLLGNYYRYTFTDTEPYNLIKVEQVDDYDGSVYMVWLIDYVQ